MLKGVALLCYIFGGGIIPVPVMAYGKLNSRTIVMLKLNINQRKLFFKKSTIKKNHYQY